MQAKPSPQDYIIILHAYQQHLDIGDALKAARRLEAEHRGIQVQENPPTTTFSCSEETKSKVPESKVWLHYLIDGLQDLEAYKARLDILTRTAQPPNMDEGVQREYYAQCYDRQMELNKKVEHLVRLMQQCYTTKDAEAMLKQFRKLEIYPMYSARIGTDSNAEAADELFVTRQELAQREFLRSQTDRFDTTFTVRDNQYQDEPGSQGNKQGPGLPYDVIVSQFRGQPNHNGEPQCYVTLKITPSGGGPNDGFTLISENDKVPVPRTPEEAKALRSKISESIDGYLRDHHPEPDKSYSEGKTAYEKAIEPIGLFQQVEYAVPIPKGRGQKFLQMLSRDGSSEELFLMRKVNILIAMEHPEKEELSKTAMKMPEKIYEQLGWDIHQKVRVNPLIQRAPTSFQSNLLQSGLNNEPLPPQPQVRPIEELMTPGGDLPPQPRVRPIEELMTPGGDLPPQPKVRSVEHLMTLGGDFELPKQPSPRPIEELMQQTGQNGEPGDNELSEKSPLEKAKLAMPDTPGGGTLGREGEVDEQSDVDVKNNLTLR